MPPPMVSPNQALPDVESYSIDVEIEQPFADQVDADGIRVAVAMTLAMHGLADMAVSVLIADDDSVRLLNRQYRGVDEPTDVLSFPQQTESTLEPTPADMPAELAAALSRHLGDLALAYPYTERQALRHGATVRAEMSLLAVHGTLHLLGYDHADAETRRRMWSAQDAVLTALGEAPYADRHCGDDDRAHPLSDGELAA